MAGNNDTREMFSGMREGKQKKRAARFAAADTRGFDCKGPYHYQTRVDGDLMDWWPSAAKWRWRNKTYFGEERHMRHWMRNRQIEAMKKAEENAEA